MPTDKRQRQKEGQRARREAARAELQKQQRRRRIRTFAILAVLVVAATALVSMIGGDDDDEASTTTEAVTTPTSAPPKTPAPLTEPVLELKTEDLKVGTGKVVQEGDTIVAHYLGMLANGKVFDSSWETGDLLEGTLGQFITGWDEGIPGMRVGGRRKLIIPAADAYGAEDTGTGRPFGDLVFIIDVYAVK